MKNKFIEQVTAQIKNKKARAQIEQELESHILDKIDYYVEIGYPYEEAERRATEEMGSPEDTALPLNALHKNGDGFFLTVAGGFFVIMLFLLSYRMIDVFRYAGYTENAVHYIKYDFISFGIFLAYVLLLVIARKKHNKEIPLMIIISFIIQISFSLVCFVLKDDFLLFTDLCAVFQPMSYAMLALVSKNFGGYIDSIFAYETLEQTLFNDYSLKVMPLIIVAVILLWAIALYLSIRRKESMSSKHIFNKALNIGEKAVSVFIAVNLFIMCLGTVVAISELSEKYDEITEQKTTMIDFVLNANVSKDYSELLYDMQNAGFNMSRDVKYDRISHDPSYDRYIFGEDINNISLMTYDEGDIRIDNICYNIAADNTIFSKNLLCYADDMKTLQDIKVGTTLDEVLQTGLIQKASYIQKSIVNGEEEIYMWFFFDNNSVQQMMEKTGDYYYYNETLRIRNGIVIDGTQAEEISMMRHTKYNMIKFIVSESQMKWDDSTGRSAESVLRLARDSELELELSTQSEKMKKKFYYYVPDQFNSMLMYVDEDSKNYSFEYYNIPEYGFISMRRDETFDGVDISEFDAITDGMTLEEYKLAYDWGMTCAGFVRSSSEYDENTQRYVYTLQFIYPLKDGDEVNQYIVEFYDGMLTKHYKNDESFLSIGYPAVD